MVIDDLLTLDDLEYPLCPNLHIANFTFWELTACSVCISVPLWQIRIFGLFFMPNPDIRIFYPDFFCAGPHRPLYCLAVVSDTGDVGLLIKIKIAVMSIRLRDGVMCLRLQIHSR